MDSPSYPDPDALYAIAPTLAEEAMVLAAVRAADPDDRFPARDYLLRHAAYWDRVALHAFRLRAEGIMTADGLKARPYDDELSCALVQADIEADDAAGLLVAYDIEHAATRGPHPPDPDLASLQAYVRQEYAHYLAAS